MGHETQLMDDSIEQRSSNREVTDVILLGSYDNADTSEIYGLALIWTFAPPKGFTSYFNFNPIKKIGLKLKQMMKLLE